MYDSQQKVVQPVYAQVLKQRDSNSRHSEWGQDNTSAKMNSPGGVPHKPRSMVIKNSNRKVKLVSGTKKIKLGSKGKHSNIKHPQKENIDSVVRGHMFQMDEVSNSDNLGSFSTPIKKNRSKDKFSDILGY
jgi:hypothetical protein